MTMAESSEKILPHIPYPELYAPEAVRYQLTRDILLDPGTSRLLGQQASGDRKTLVSPVDLRRVPTEMSDQDLLDAVSKHLDASLGRIDEEPTSGEEKVKFEKHLADINLALTDAQTYLREQLGIPVPSASVHSKKDIVDLLKRATLYKQTYRKGLEKHAGYCALISVALAVFELQKKEALTLEGEMNYIAQFLTQSTQANGGVSLFTKHTTGDIGDVIHVDVNDVSPPVRARLSMRDKKPDSQITKYLRIPEATAEGAQKDAIGLRLEFANDRMEDVLVKALNYLQEQMVAKNLHVQDRNLLDTEKGRLNDFKTRKAAEVHNSDEIPVISQTSLLAADSYKDIKVTCTLTIPRGGDSNAKQFAERAIEIQLVEPENKNESGLSSHAVYELKKKITVMSRLFGGCSDQWLTGQAKEIAQKEGFPPEFVHNVIHGLQDVGFMLRLPNTPNKKVYAARQVYDRWMRVDGLIENERIRSQVAHRLRGGP